MRRYVFPIRLDAVEMVRWEPRKSFNRPGYGRTLWNPAGWHVGMDVGGRALYRRVVQAVAPGTITRRGAYGDLGLVVAVGEWNAWGGGEWWYAHLDSFGGYRVGDKINAGAGLARLGSSGNSTGPHVHVARLAYPLGGGRWGSVPYTDPYPFVRAAWEEATT